MADLIQRKYKMLAGVDFSSAPNMVALNRSYEATNMYRDYASTSGNSVDSRIGYSKLATIGTKINGIYFYEISGNVRCIVHSKDKLYYWSNFPSEPDGTSPLIELYASMNDTKSAFVVFGVNLYILDGKNYLVYNGTTCVTVASTAYIPTTSINRIATGGGTIYQGVNLLTGKRVNTFIGDNTSTDYYLDSTSINSVESVYVNGILKTVTTHYTVNTTTGKISFTTGNKANAPATAGQANITVNFTKTISGYIDRIQQCTIAKVFDRRIFFSGNPTYKNALFNSALENPAYISDLDYYQDGTDTIAIKDLVISDNLIYAFKESSQQNPTVFYHVPTLDFTYGKIYPSTQGNVSLGCYSKGINFNDDIVFMSKKGLEAISSEFTQERLLQHRSHLVDNKMINEADFEDCEMQEWNGYLMCMINGKIYLADSRQKYSYMDSFAYEWYYWDNIQCDGSLGRILKEYNGDLYFGCSNGDICKFGGTNDNGGILYASWTTPKDDFGIGNKLKTTNKRGGVAKVNVKPNGEIKIDVKTNEDNYKFYKKYSANGFSYEDFTYVNFTYVLGTDNNIVYKVRKKNIEDITLKFYTDTLDKPFGLYEAVIEAFVGKYIKN